MKKIGFLDYELDEWHANHYVAWIREDIARKGRDMELAYAYADQDRPGGMGSDAWCEAYGLARVHSIEKLVEVCDYIMLLAPDDPEQHERLARLPLASGKPVYIDKTFAPDLPAAMRIFDMAEKGRTPMFSASALRYTKELIGFANQSHVRFAAVKGAGNFEDHIIHKIEMLIGVMGPDIRRVKGFSGGDSHAFWVDYRDGRRATMLQLPAAAYEADAQLDTGAGFHAGDTERMFQDMLSGILDFYEDGRAPVSAEETLAAIALRDACVKAAARNDTWIDVGGRP